MAKDFKKIFKDAVYSKITDYVVNLYSEKELYGFVDELLAKCLCDIEKVESYMKKIESRLEVIVKINESLNKKRLKALN